MQKIKINDKVTYFLAKKETYNSFNFLQMFFDGRVIVDNIICRPLEIIEICISKKYDAYKSYFKFACIDQSDLVQEMSLYLCSQDKFQHQIEQMLKESTVSITSIFSYISAWLSWRILNIIKTIRNHYHKHYTHIDKIKFILYPSLMDYEIPNFDYIDTLAVLDTLNDKEKEIFNYRICKNMEIVNIAELIGIKPRSLYRIWNKILKKIEKNEKKM